MRHRVGPPQRVGDVLGRSEPRCRSCGAPVIWAQMPSGKMNPIDPEPTPRGNVVLYRKPDGSVRGEMLKAGEESPPGAQRRRSHYVSCPQRNKWRKRR